jgi:hypothetical protein
VTTPEVAAALRVTTRAVQLAIRRGTLAARKIGRDHHVEPEEVERYRRENAGRTGRPAKKNPPE